jgi:multidrug efflux pump subunit AcrB
MFGRILVPLDEEQILVVPRQAVQTVGQLDLVAVATQGAVSRRAVRLGRTIGTDVEVLSGLREGEQVQMPVIGSLRTPEKAALSGVSPDQIASTLQAVLGGTTVGLVRSNTERNPLRIELRLPVEQRTCATDLAQVRLKGDKGHLVPLAELGRWETARVDQMIYHKNLQRVAYGLGWHLQPDSGKAVKARIVSSRLDFQSLEHPDQP